MLVFPSMNIYQDKVVKVYSGFDNDMSILSTEPFDTVSDLLLQKATHLHIVDIEGTRTGRFGTVEICRKIKRDTDLFVQIGGGIRNIEGVKRYIDAGADRVVIGTVAAEKEDIVKEAAAMYGDRIAVAIDMKDGYVMVNGRTRKTNLTVRDFAKRMQETGVKTLLCTDVAREGTDCGVDVDLFEDLRKCIEADIIVSGGVTSLEDILLLQDMGIYGVLVEKAYYDGAIYVKSAIRLAK